MNKKFINNPVETYEKLKAENERLKAEITELEEKFLTLNGKSYLYYTTLQEIKEIADSVMNEYKKVCGNPLALYHTEINGASSVAKQILQLIDEAEV